jgi:hypothetical protein
MEKQIHSPYLLRQRWCVGRIAYVGVAACRIRIGGKHPVRHNGAVGLYEIGAVFYVPQLADGDLVEVAHPAVDVSRLLFLFEYVSNRGYAVAQWHGSHGDGIVLKYYSLFGSDYVEFHLYRKVAGEESENLVQYPFSFLECMDCEMSASSGQPQSAYKSRQTEHMVSVEMCEEYVAHTVEL